MTLLAGSAGTQRFTLSYSQRFLRLEVLSHFLCLIVLANRIEDHWSLLVFVLAVLLSLHYFNNYSIRHCCRAGAAIEFRVNPERLIWYDPPGQVVFSASQVKVRLTRWFVMIQMSNSQDSIVQLLLSDSFRSTRDYAAFRRMVMELSDAG